MILIFPSLHYDSCYRRLSVKAYLKPWLFVTIQCHPSSRNTRVWYLIYTPLLFTSTIPQITRRLELVDSYVSNFYTKFFLTWKQWAYGYQVITCQMWSKRFVAFGLHFIHLLYSRDLLLHRTRQSQITNVLITYLDSQAAQSVPQSRHAILVVLYEHTVQAQSR